MMKHDPKETSVIVGMSGGVDSSVAAALLVEKGYQVSGVFMQNWEAENDDPYCLAEQDLTDARAVCDRLDISLSTVNFAKKYWDNVFQHFLNEYSQGRTPNPDILCNREIKFKAFLDYAIEEGADFIATGHYARIDYYDNQYRLLRGVDNNKDQSYFLYTLGQNQLAKSLFPVGSLQKPQVRELAKKHGFDNFAKKDSTGICFIGERKFNQFLNEYILTKPGDIQTPDGKTIAQHQGLMFYTLGQRQGLGIGGLTDYPEAPWYVVAKNIPENILIVAQDHQHPLLMGTELTCNELSWVSEKPPTFPLDCTAKIRYRQNDERCKIVAHQNQHLHVIFHNQQRAITPGQSVVFYQGNECLGGGVITKDEK